MSTPTLSRMNELLAKIRAAKAAESAQTSQQTPAQTVVEIPSIPERTLDQTTDKYGNVITLNAKQIEFIKLACTGQSCVLIGAAGVGKTTCQKAATQALIQSGLAGILEPQGHKHLASNVPGIVITAYTRRATANIRRNLSTELQANCLTIHKLLEYQPVYNDVFDAETGETRTKMSFQATRNAANPLPSSIRVIIIEEASMVGTDLFQEILDACPHNPQFNLKTVQENRNVSKVREEQPYTFVYNTTAEDL